MRYYIADNHFFHRNLNDKMDMRGFASVEEMNEYMISQWNSKVRNGDEVIILGDFSFGKAEETIKILNRLKGHLYLILGNHDKWYKKAKDYNRFKWVKDYAELHDEGRNVICCHYPIMCYNHQLQLDKNGNSNTYMLYGHIHNTEDVIGCENYQNFIRSHNRTYFEGGQKNEESYPEPINMINCFCMNSDYIPLTLDEWIDLYKEKSPLSFYTENMERLKKCDSI